MKTISSFKIDHDMHGAGFYLGGQNGDIFTYDLRFKTPNGGDYLSNEAMHSVEHLFATVIRNGDLSGDVIYFGPMGCRTGFYLLLRNVTYERAKEYTVSVLRQCLAEQQLPGAERKQCGNYKEHDLQQAKCEIEKYLVVLAE